MKKSCLHEHDEYCVQGVGSSKTNSFYVNIMRCSMFANQTITCMYPPVQECNQLLNV